MIMMKVSWTLRVLVACAVANLVAPDGWSIYNLHRRRAPGREEERRSSNEAADFVSTSSGRYATEPPAYFPEDAWVNETENADGRAPYRRIQVSAAQPGAPAGGGADSMNAAVIASLFGGQSPTPAAQARRPHGQAPHLKNAKKFWNHFMFRRRSDSQETVLPIKTNELQQETCRALPFAQSIVHENCEKVVLKNKLCFGRCSSFHVPSNEDRLYTFCSYCFPTKYTMKNVELNCTGSESISKLVMMVEECQCEAQKGRQPQSGPFILDPSSGVFGGRT
ncbi:cerberus-like [Erpetoichthys calabaricus]|uniref:CTCK domain-containing protein n=1 Tax=Erpetoichthys calabaricus TaxID=27687 RepID=A0A8C4S3S4_ERPCA|nr:cerberus-like [Erpetoichthys calabaricus]